jgi:hypothetical protein
MFGMWFGSVGMTHTTDVGLDLLDQEVGLGEHLVTSSGYRLIKPLPLSFCPYQALCWTR